MSREKTLQDIEFIVSALEVPEKILEFNKTRMEKKPSEVRAQFFLHILGIWICGLESFTPKLYENFLVAKEHDEDLEIKQLITQLQEKTSRVFELFRDEITFLDDYMAKMLEVDLASPYTQAGARMMEAARTSFTEHVDSVQAESNRIDIEYDQLIRDVKDVLFHEFTKLEEELAQERAIVNSKFEKLQAQLTKLKSTEDKHVTFLGDKAEVVDRSPR